MEQQTRLVQKGQGAYLMFPDGSQSGQFHGAVRGIDVLDAHLATGRVQSWENSELRRQIIEHFEPHWRGVTSDQPT